MSRSRETSAQQTERTCELYRAAVAAGENASAVVGHLASMYDVQRAAIWKRLRAGGVIAPYAPRESGGKGRPVGGGAPGYTARRRERSVAFHERQAEAPLPPRVDRDPCPRCGVRGDIGCEHSRAPLGMIL